MCEWVGSGGGGKCVFACKLYRCICLSVVCVCVCACVSMCMDVCKCLGVCVCVQVCVWMYISCVYVYVCICTLWADSYMIHHFFQWLTSVHRCHGTRYWHSWCQLGHTVRPSQLRQVAVLLFYVSVSCYPVCLTCCWHICQFVLVLWGCCAAVQFLKETSPLKTFSNR